MVSLSIDPPPNSRQPRSSGRGLLVAVYVVSVLVALGAGFWLGRSTAPAERALESAGSGGADPTAAAVTSTAAATPTSTSTATSTPTAAPTPGAMPAGATPAPTPAVAAVPPAPVPQGSRRVVATLQGPLEDSIRRALAPEEKAIADELTQVVNRLLVWDLQVARDGRKGDRVEVVYTPAAAVAPGLAVSGEPVVEAVRYASQKLGKVFAAYRFQPEGARWPRYFREDGTELEEQLVDAPIGEYEQVTSLLRDGRRHKGVDFKAPVGSPVFAPFDGVIERRNWNFRANGNCLEIRDVASGRRAIFLHLDVLPKDMTPGRRVRKGERIAASGNSGRSYAPHLHYQLETADGRVLDPYEVHRTTRRAVAAAERAGFEVSRARLDAALGTAPQAVPVSTGAAAAPVAVPAVR
jgi:murein DD-endopeptidase MepM/ murein hydrolase activator NlpD